MLAFLVGFFGQFLHGIRGWASRIACAVCSNRLMEGSSEDECPLCEGDPHFLEADRKEVPVEKTCLNSCGRPAAEGYDSCCRTCIASSGRSHGPVCESRALADDKTTEAPTPAKGRRVWWVDLGSWVRIDNETQERIEAARREGRTEVEFHVRGHPYLIDLVGMAQINLNTGMQRDIKSTESEEDEPHEEDEEEDEESDNEITPPWLQPRSSREVAAAPTRSPRLVALVNLLLSPAVQVPLPAEATKEDEKLSQEEVKKVFKEHVKGVEKYLFRDMPGQYSLNFLASAYQNGLRAFNGTPMDNHLKWLMRSIVHYGHEKKPGAARYLKEVAEAFLDCQAVQARVVERVGLELLGVSQDFKGLVRAMVGDYKVMAIKMLAIDHLSRGVVSDDGNPTHYENRLTANLGSLVGLNKDDIRRADLDEHARNRFGRLHGPSAEKAVQRFKELFDIEALAKTFCNEVNSFNENSSNDSLPGQFMKWADEKMTQKHSIFDEETCCRVDVQEPLAIALLEVLFAGKPSNDCGEEYRGVQVQDLFKLELCAVVAMDNPKVEAKPAKSAMPKSGKAKSPPGKKARTKR